MSKIEEQHGMESVWAIPSILKGLLESHDTWEIFAPECEPFWSVISKLKQKQSVPTASRGVSLACEAGKPSVVFIPNRQLASVIEIARDLEVSLPLILIVEDHPVLTPQLCPRELSAHAGICVVEPCDPSEVEHCAAAAAKLSMASHSAVVLIMHHGLLGGSASVERSNEPSHHAPRQTGEHVTPLQLSRRLELNRQRTLPSPGEKVSVGFVTIGLADPALRYLVSELHLLGRVPMLNLRLIHPIDVVPIERLLSRCRHVVVLEPRPGEVEQIIVGVAQSMLREGREVAAIWGRELPPLNPEDHPIKVQADTLHPSVVARLTQHLLHDVRPSAHIGEQLLTAETELKVRSSRRRLFGTKAALQLLRETAKRVLDSQSTIGDLVIDGVRNKVGDGEHVYVETWGAEQFASGGINIVRHASERSETRILLVWCGHKVGKTLAAMFEPVIPTKGEDYKNVIEVSLDNGEDVDAVIIAASTHPGVTVIIVDDGEEPRFDIERLSEIADEIDRLGFRPQHAIVIPNEQMAAVRMSPFELRTPKAGSLAMPLETSITTQWLQSPRRLRASLRPLMERVEVTRSNPPVRVVTKSVLRLSPPVPIHASAPQWRVHIAGSRGDQPGVVGQVLMEAGKQMGYEVRAQCNSTFIGAGRRAWSQVLFTRKQTKRSYRPLVGTIPWGEADLLLGWDREEVLRAINPKETLRVGSPDRTYAVINTDPLENQSSLTDLSGNQFTLDLRTIATSCKTDVVVLRGFSSLARYRFHNERLGDIVQLGMAFQLGMIPVTVDAMNAAVVSVELGGYARSVEAFAFGRRVALDPNVVWQPVKGESHVDLDRLIKQCIRDLYKHGRRGATKADVVRRLIRRSREALPGLTETVEGRLALVDLVIGIQRCMLWGGEEVARRFVSLICQLYTVDRAETGRALTRKVVLPLVESILIRDQVYLARLARSPEVLRRIRHRLNVRHSRGDILKRRYLSRFRLRLWNWSLQIDLRTSDWSPVLISMLGHAVPKHWRGTRRDRLVREAITHAVRQASTSTDNYDDWIRRFEQLNKLACSGELHTVTVEEINKILQS